MTDLTRWRLDSSDNGRHVWHYVRTDDTPYEILWGEDTAGVRARATQTDEERYWLGLEMGPTHFSGADEETSDETSRPLSAESFTRGARRGFDFYKRLQAPDGHWSGEYGGPLFLTPGFVVTMYIMGETIPAEWRTELTRYLFRMQRSGGPGDEGWGLHIEAPSSVFGTAMNYVALRLLGAAADDPRMVRARGTLHGLGGATGIPSWGKFWLALLNVYSWEGQNYVPSELWILPSWVPIHPSRWWVHCRNVYIPMGFLHGKKFSAPLDPLLRALREELYTEPYAEINWPACRNKVAAADLYCPHTRLAEFLFGFTSVYDQYAPAFIRNAALRRAYDLIVMEDENTTYQTLGPVNKCMNMLARFVQEGRDSEAVRQHLLHVRDFFWMSDKGMMMCGTNGSQSWDLSFISQAVCEAGLAEENISSLQRMLEWFDASQIRDNPKYFGAAFRHASKGAWPFSTREQSYTVSDCTAEALKSVLLLQKVPGVVPLIDDRRLCDAVDIIIGMQNPNGGFASYELIRGSTILEWLNVAEVFSNIMVEYAYPECTTACLTALTLFRRQYPAYRAAEIDAVITRAIAYIRTQQRADGSWYGSWAICFAYATMFAVESLSIGGETYENSDSIRRACSFLLAHQRDDGGWGESYKSSELHRYVQSETSQVVGTAWAVLTLITARYPDPAPIRRGAQLILSRQLPNGSWAQENIEGVFNHNCAISYPNYKFSWTIHALGRAARYLREIESEK